MKHHPYLLALSILHTACASIAAPIPVVETSPASTSQPPQLIDYKNTTYLIEGQFVTLTDGFFEVESAPVSETQITTRYFGNEAIGDLNGDGKDDVAFLLTQDPGGSGLFFYVVAGLQTASGVEGTNAIFLGDRIAPQNSSIENGIITVNYADRNPGEPFTTQPSLGISKYFTIENKILTETQNP